MTSSALRIRVKGRHSGGGPAEAEALAECGHEPGTEDWEDVRLTCHSVSLESLFDKLANGIEQVEESIRSELAAAKAELASYQGGAA